MYGLVSLRICVDFDVDFVEVLNWVLLHGVVVAVLFVADCDEAKLLPPVTEIIEGNSLPGACSVQIDEECSDDSGSKMADMEFLGNIRGAVF
jgi:hypothetical protein